MTTLPGLPPTLPTANPIELIETVCRAFRAGATSYDDLTWIEKNWAFDHARSMLQTAGIPVNCKATWRINVPPPNQPVRSVNGLLTLLDAADLSGVPNSVVATLTIARSLAKRVENEAPIAIDKLDRALKLLDGAKLELAGVPNPTAIAVMSSRCFFELMMSELMMSEMTMDEYHRMAEATAREPAEDAWEVYQANEAFYDYMMTEGFVTAEEAWEVNQANEAIYEYTMSDAFPIEEFINELEEITDFPAKYSATLRAAVLSAIRARKNGCPDVTMKIEYANILLNEAEEFLYETLDAAGT